MREEFRLKESLSLVFPMLIDVITVYESFRKQGYDRDDSIHRTVSKFSCDSLDLQDEALIWIGLSMAMAKNKELNEDIRTKANKSFCYTTSLFPEVAENIQREKERINNPICLGSEKKYPIRRLFKPDWKIGDTFLQKMDGEYPQKYGMANWFSIIRKIDEYQDNDGHWVEFVYLTVCEPNNVPHNIDNINQLGYIPISSYKKNGEKEFRAGIRVTSARELNKFQLMYIGNYANARPPMQECIPSHDTYYPLFPRQDAKPPLPEHPGSIILKVCENYKKFGRLH